MGIILMNCFVLNSFSESLILSNDNRKVLRQASLSLRMNKNSQCRENNGRRNILKTAAAVSSLSIFNAKSASAEKTGTWERISLPVDTVLFDLDFVKDTPQHGWLVGSKGTFLETLDGGETWVPRTFANLDPDEELTYRFENVSFSGNDGWVIGKPAIMLHTKDGGKSWLRVPVSPKLPGEPVLITALGPDRAEMTTSSGAVYETTNGGRNWKAQVKETIDSTLNRTISSGISGASYFTGSVIGVIRDADGKYLAISSRGNFFLTWEPGQDFWIPRARETSRRIQAMGFIENNADKGIWMSTRGGGLSFTTDVELDSVNSFDFQNSDIKTGGYGILDVAYKTSKEMWAACGGGTLYKSVDGGKTWSKDNDTGKIPGNLYKIKFFGPKQGFVLGSSGILLKYRS